MLYTKFAEITKDEVLTIIVILIFLYLFWFFFRYSFTPKHYRYSKEVYSYEDVESRREINELKYSVIRYPDNQHKIKDTRQAVFVAVEALGGMRNFVKPGDRVLIKVNICEALPEIPATYTTMEVAGVVVDMIREVGGIAMICDSDITTKFWNNAKEEGWIDWANQKGVVIVNLSETRISNFNFGDKSILNTELVSKEMIKADVIISIPAMKTDLLTGITLGMKNMYGILPEFEKIRYYKLGIDEVIYWINFAFTPNLTIIDGSIGGETLRPLSYDAVDFKTIIASTNVVTADAIASQLIGFEKPDEEIDHIKIAHERGLGDALQKFDFSDLPYNHPSDGNWKLPEPIAKSFYKWSIEIFLKHPGWGTLYNIGGDFFFALLRLSNLIGEIKENAEKTYQESKGTPNEEIARNINQVVQEWQISDQKQMTRKVENLTFSIKAKIPDIPTNKLIHDKIEDITKEKDIVKQYEHVAILIALIPQKIGEIYMENVFKNIQNSTIINESVVIDSFNKVKKKYDEEVAKALLQIGEFIEKSGDVSAGILFNKFNEELNKPQPEKGTLKKIWDGIEKTLPAIKTLADVIIKLSPLF